jgi:hypothetical protein
MKHEYRQPVIHLNVILGCIFVTLKLCKVIDWPWLWVTCPFWIPVAIIFGIFAIIGIVLGGALLLDMYSDYKKNKKKKK